MIVRLSWYDRVRNGDARKWKNRLSELEADFPEIAAVWHPLAMEHARVHYSLGDTQRCRRILEDFVARHQSGKQVQFGYWAQAHLMLGFLAETDGEQEEAVEFWKRGQFEVWNGLCKRPTILRDHSKFPQIYHAMLALLAEKPSASSVIVALRDTRVMDHVPAAVVAALKNSAKKDLLAYSDEKWRAVLSAIGLGALANRLIPLAQVSGAQPFRDAIRNYVFRTKGFGDLYREPVALLATELIRLDLAASFQIALSPDELVLAETTTRAVIDNSNRLLGQDGRQYIKSLIGRWFERSASNSLTVSLAAIQQLSGGALVRSKLSGATLSARVAYFFALIAKTDAHRSALLLRVRSTHDPLLLRCVQARVPAKQ